MMQEIKLQGIVVVNDFDTKGNPVCFALLTDDENKFIMEKNKPDVSFAEYNRKKVAISGLMHADGKKNVVGVNTIELLPRLSTTSPVDIL